MVAHFAFRDSRDFGRMGFVSIRSTRKQEVTAQVIFRHEHLFLPGRSADFRLVEKAPAEL